MPGNIKKAELHCHLDGIISKKMINKHSVYGLECPLKESALEQIIPIKNLDDFSRWFQIIGPVFTGKLLNYRFVMEKHIEELVYANCTYTEIMVAKSEMSKDKSLLLDTFQEFRAFLNKLERQQSIQIELIIALGRNKEPEFLAEQVERTLLLYEHGLICGVALAGPEEGNPVKKFRKSFDMLHESGMGIEIHSGEWCGPESVWDALTNGHPDRIGHGLAVFQDDALIEYILEHDIHIEFCPTSNCVLTDLGAIEQHPIFKAKSLNINFSINTDDPGPLGISLDSEFELVRNVFHFTEDDFNLIYNNSLRSSFRAKNKLG